jgi:hypothetical protein
MAPTNRRQFIQQTAFTATFYGSSVKALAGTRRAFEAGEQNTGPLDTAAIGRLASRLAGA